MRIPSVESDHNSKTQALFDKRVSQLLGKVANLPILLQKITLTKDAPVVLNTAPKSAISQLQLPLNSAPLLQPLLTGKAKLLLTLSNDRVIINIESAKNSAVELAFKQAQVVDRDILRLTKPVFSQSQIQQLAKQSTAEGQQVKLGTSHIQRSATSNSLAQPNASDQLLNTVKDLLKTRQLNTPNIGQSLNRLFASEQNLIKTITEPVTNKNFPQLNQLSKSDLVELLQKSTSLLSQNSAASKLIKINQLVTQLKQQLAFSKSNPQLSVAQRIKQSGNFMESQLSNSRPNSVKSEQTHQLQNQLVTPNKKIKVSQNIASKESREAALKSRAQTTSGDLNLSLQQKTKNNALDGKGSVLQFDIKFTMSQLKSLVGELQLLLSNKDSKPINTVRLIQQLIQTPELSRQISQLVSQSTQQTNTVQGSEQSAPPPASVFNSKLLQELILNPANLQILRRIVLDKQQEGLQVNQQRQLLTEMLSDVTNTLAKIETNQLLSLRHEISHLQQFLTEIPIYRFGQVDTFELLLAQESAPVEKSGVKSWTITIRFDLEPLGPMFARVSLKNQRISTRFFTQNESTSALLNEHLDYLKQSFHAVGIKIDELEGSQGIVPEELVRNPEHSVDLKV